MTTMAFSPDGTMLLAGGGANGTDFEPGPPQDHDRRVWVWDIDSGDLVQYLEHPTTVSALAFSPDGTHLATASGTTVQLWTLTSP
jgi:WD40 repeat protein